MFLERLLELLRDRYRVAALVGDLATDNDAKRLARAQVRTQQITTGTVCHLDAPDDPQRALKDGTCDELDFLFVENVGNLVCPSTYDLGESLRVVLLSVTEGEDKPLKYPPIFNSADVADHYQGRPRAARWNSIERRRIEAFRASGRVCPSSKFQQRPAREWKTGCISFNRALPNCDKTLLRRHQRLACTGIDLIHSLIRTVARTLPRGRPKNRSRFICRLGVTLCGSSVQPSFASHSQRKESMRCTRFWERLGRRLLPCRWRLVCHVTRCNRTPARRRGREGRREA